MKKKRPQQQATPPTNGLNILAIKRAPKQVESPQEEPAVVSVEKSVSDTEPVAPTAVSEPAEDALVPEPVVPPPVDEPESASSPEKQALFQAVGVIQGGVIIDGDKIFVTIGEKQYGLFYSSNHKRAYDALKKEIEITGEKEQRLIVYPRVTHFPGGKQPYQLSFQLAGFVGHKASGEGLESVLEDFEFKICGLWQFIPVCRVPCISVFKNFDKQRLEYIKSATVDKKVNFMKASHVPVMWRDAPVPPFRFNPKLDKEAQGKACFVQIKARFNSVSDAFEFLSLLEIPTEKPPNYLKAGKKDKAEVMKTKLAASKGKKRSTIAPDNAAKKTSGATPKPKPKPKIVAESEVS